MGKRPEPRKRLLQEPPLRECPPPERGVQGRSMGLPEAPLFSWVTFVLFVLFVPFLTFVSLVVHLQALQLYLRPPDSLAAARS